MGVRCSCTDMLDPQNNKIREQKKKLLTYDVE